MMNEHQIKLCKQKLLNFKVNKSAYSHQIHLLNRKSADLRRKIVISTNALNEKVRVAAVENQISTLKKKAYDLQIKINELEKQLAATGRYSLGPKARP